MHHYPFHIGDYLLHTVHLDDAHDLAYRRLLDLYYQTEACIPLETDQVSRRLRLGSEVVSKVLHEFFQKREDGWHQTRCDEVIAQYQAKKGRAKTNGTLGGRPRKTQKKPKSEPDRNPKITGSKANQEPITKNQNHSQESVMDWPQRIVEAYVVRRDAPVECMAAVAMAIGAGDAPEVILQAVREIVALCYGAPGGASNRYIPSALRFFTEAQWRSPEAFQQRWKDQKHGQGTHSHRTDSANPPGRYANALSSAGTGAGEAAAG